MISERYLRKRKKKDVDIEKPGLESVIEVLNEVREMDEYYPSLIVGANEDNDGYVGWLGEAYLNILKENGFFNQYCEAHITEIILPGTDKLEQQTRAFSVLSGEQYYQNAFYGIAIVDFVLWEDRIYPETLSFMRKYMADNVNNTIWIMNNCSQILTDELRKWKEVEWRVFNSYTSTKQIGF